MKVEFKNIPKIAIVGKPNVGKSTLVNRLCKSSEAIVHSEPKITRDRKYYETEWDGNNFYFLDTGGIDKSSGDKLALQILMQTIKAVDESDLVVFIVDISEPMTVLDREIADILRKKSKKVIIAANKADNISDDYNIDEYTELGFGIPVKISAIHGLGINDFLDLIIEELGDIDIQQKDVRSDEADIPRICILGKPNVGKSTLFNSIIKEQRVIVDDIEGTTRDTIDSMIVWDNKKYIITDTAGLKRKNKKNQDLEYYSKVRTLKAIGASDVGIILIDSLKDVTNQDIKIVEMCIKRGCSMCMVFNKIDIADKELLRKNIEDLNDGLVFADYIPFLKISALSKKGIESMFNMIDDILEQRKLKISDNSLNRLFKDILSRKDIYSKNKKFKVKFIKQIRVNPPGFIIFSNIDLSGKKNIKKFIENTIRDEYGFTGTPISFKTKY